MQLRNSPSRYGSLSISLHWLMLVLLAAVYACIEFSDNFPKGSDMRADLKTWHFMLGLSVFAVVWLRLAVKLSGTTPRIDPEPAGWQNRAARWLQLALYLLMIGMPLAGWLLLSADGKPVPFFGLELPALMGPNKNSAEWLKEIHETGGTIGYFLVGLHAAAALFHHYVLKDNTLRRMLPGRN